MIQKIKDKLSEFLLMHKKLDTLIMLEARNAELLNLQNTEAIIQNIQKAEFKAFSQCGDDGIISFLVDYLSIENKTFIEFGTENYDESNTKYLLKSKNWSGLIIDGSEVNINYVKRGTLYWMHDLTAVCEFVTKDNINQILKTHQFEGTIGLLHIDIDGNDYWVWDSISVVDPEIVIVEYNSLFGSKKLWTVPYRADFIRTKSHFSNLYFGASLAALCKLASKKGYFFVGCNSTGNNAYFVKNKYKGKLKELSVEEGFVESRFRESRDEKGRMSFLKKNSQMKMIEGLPIHDLVENKVVSISWDA